MYPKSEFADFKIKKKLSCLKIGILTDSYGAQEIFLGILSSPPQPFPQTKKKYDKI